MQHYEQPWAGGTVYNCIQNCLRYVQQSSNNAMTTTINEVTIVVYKESFISDLCDKYDMQRKITYKQY